jgi:hypothetical protein
MTKATPDTLSEKGERIKVDGAMASTGGLSRDDLHKAFELAEELNTARSPQQRGADTRKVARSCSND